MTVNTAPLQQDKHARPFLFSDIVPFLVLSRRITSEII